MPYPNDNRLNVVIAQTSASADLTGKFPFTETIISGSRLILQTDSTGTLIGSTDINVTNLTASFISASRIATQELTASQEVFIGNPTSQAGLFKTRYELVTPDNVARLSISGSATLVSKFATLTLGVTQSVAGGQSGIDFSILKPISEASNQMGLDPRWSLYSPSGSNDLRLFGYYISNDPDNGAQGSVGANNVAGDRLVIKQNGYLGIGAFYSYGSSGGRATDYISSLPGYISSDNGKAYYGPDALLTILPLDSGSAGTGASRSANRNILNVMFYDTSSLMFISGSDGYLVLGKTQSDGFNRLQIVGNVSASVYTGSYGTITNLFTTNLTSSYISASNLISSSNLYIKNSIYSSGSLTVIGPVVLGDTLSDTIKMTGSVGITGSLRVDGPIYGTIDSALTASTVNITNQITSDSTYYPTFVDSTGSARVLYADTNKLSYNPYLNQLSLGPSTSGSLFIGDAALNPNKITISSDSATGAYIQIGSAIGNISSSLTMGDASSSSGSFIVQTYSTLLTPRGVNTDLPISTSNATQATTWNNGALVVGGGAGIGKNLYVSGSTFLYGDLTIYGSSSIVTISSSTVIIGDNRLVLNASTPIQRYAGLDVYDSGSGAISNNVTSSLLWDGLTDNWLLVSNNKPIGSSLTQSSAIVIGGPSGSFGSEGLLTQNYLPKVQSSGKNLTNSSIYDDGISIGFTLPISASQLTASNALFTNVFSTNISSSTLTASNAWITNLSSSQITASNGLFTNIFTSNISASSLTASNAWIVNLSSSAISASIGTFISVYATNVSASNLTASNISLSNISASRITSSNGLILNLSSSAATITNIYSNYISSSVITSSNLRVDLTGSITYATGVLITYATGSFSTLTVKTGSFPGTVPGLVPTTPTSSGMPGQINVDNNFIYVYTNEVWKRIPLSQWSN